MRRNYKEINYRCITINAIKVDENCNRIGQDAIDVRDVLEVKAAVLGH